MLPWKTIIKTEKSSNLPVYLQIANSIIKEIKRGTIKAGGRMPGSRQMAEALSVHRKTIVNAYDELLAQNWLTTTPSKGTFVSEHLPEITPLKFNIGKRKTKDGEGEGFSFKEKSFIHVPSKTWRDMTGFHDGPDVRLVPYEIISKTYRSIMNRKSSLINFSYVDGEGKYTLRKVLSDYLNDSRGLQTTYENIFLTRGSQMGIYLATEVLLKKDDNVIIGNLNYEYVNLTFLNRGCKLNRVPVDDDGLDVAAIEKICKRKKIRAVYVTPHHHFPTTVTLSAARRMQLLTLSEKFGFIILEDDYDYDFHYKSAPILPLASADHKGMVIYVGTLSKSVAPALRIGYVVASKKLVMEFARLRQLIDVQGDPFMEQTVAELFLQGEIRRHMKKVLKEYEQRRDFMCAMLKEKLSDVIDFNIPNGGIAIWAKFDKKINLPELALELRRKDLVLSGGTIHNHSGEKLNSTRMGFGWMNIRETERAINKLNEHIRKKASPLTPLRRRGE